MRKSKKEEDQEDRVEDATVPSTRNEHRVLYLKPCPTKLRPFDPNCLIFKPGKDEGFEPDKLILLFGKRRTGKSFAMRSLPRCSISERYSASTLFFFF